MRKIAAALFSLLLGLASAAAQNFPQNVPDHSVIGRAGPGNGSGPAQAVPWSALAGGLQQTGTACPTTLALFQLFVNTSSDPTSDAISMWDGTQCVPVGTLNRTTHSFSSLVTSVGLDTVFGTTRGSLIERGASAWGAVAPGTAGFPFVSNGVGADPAYQALSLSGTAVSGTLPTARGGTNGTSAAAARASGGLNIENFVGHGQGAVTIAATDRVSGTNGAFSSSNTWTLPAASAVNAGQQFVVADFQGTVTATNTLVISRAGSDTVNGGTAVTIGAANGAYLLWSDGASKWSAAPIAATTTTSSSAVSTQGFITGLQPLKLGGATIAVNPGSWANNIGTQGFSTSAVMSANLQAALPDFSTTPATGAMVSGALTATANTSDGTEVFLYLIHRNSDNKPALIGSSADTQSASQTVTATAAAPGVFTTGAVHGLRKRMAIYFSNSGGALPAPVAANTQYYVCTVPSTTTFTIATSLANVNAGTCLTTTTTGTGTNTALWGVQRDIDFQLGAGVATFDRRLPYFCFVWSWSKYGSSGVPGGTNGIPDFQVAQGASDTIITNGGQATVFQALANGVATTFTAVDLSPWLANLNRRVLIFTTCNFPSTAGGCFIRASGSGGPGVQVGAPITATIDAVGMYQFQTDSTTHIDYKVTGGAQLNIFVMGWTFVDPS